MTPPRSPHAPTTDPPPGPRRRRGREPALIGILLVLYAMFTVGQALYLDVKGVTAQAEVVAAKHGGRRDFVRVRLTTGQETRLWAWEGSPGVGTKLDVVYAEEHDWARDARTFAPTGRLWLGFGLGFWFLLTAVVLRVHRARSRVDPD